MKAFENSLRAALELFEENTNVSFENISYAIENAPTRFYGEVHSTEVKVSRISDNIIGEVIVYRCLDQYEPLQELIVTLSDGFIEALIEIEKIPHNFEESLTKIETLYGCDDEVEISIITTLTIDGEDKEIDTSIKF